MNKVTITLSNGKNIVEKAEIGSSKDLEPLFNRLKDTMFDRSPQIVDIDGAISDKVMDSLGVEIKSPDTIVGGDIGRWRGKIVSPSIPNAIENWAVNAGSGIITGSSNIVADPKGTRITEEYNKPINGCDLNDIKDNGEYKLEPIKVIDGKFQISPSDLAPKIYNKDEANIECGKLSSDTLSQSKEKKNKKEATNPSVVKEDKVKKEGFFIMKCPKCGKMKCFKSNTDTLYHCECGETFSTSKYIKIYGKCPNCSNNLGTLDWTSTIVATLEGMDISEGMHCNRCKGPVDFTYNKAKHTWVSLND